jgi:hypothetical protein
MRYVKQDDSTIHYIGDIRAANPNSSIPDDSDCTSFGYAFLQETPPPEHQSNYSVVEIAPISNVQQWARIGRHSAEIKANHSRAVQTVLDAKAQSMGYDSILAAITYADEPAVPAFQADGLALRAWRSSVWAHVFAAFEVGTPSEQELIASLPQL